MKTLLITLLVICFSFTAFSQTTPKQQKIRSYLEMKGVAKIAVQGAVNIISTMKDLYPNVSEQFWKEYFDNLQTEDFLTLIIPLYDKYYTEDDLDQMIAFYNTPAGRKIISVLPKISQDVLPLAKEWGARFSEKLLKQLGEKGYKKE